MKSVRALTIEENYVALIVEGLGRSGISHSEFGRQAYGEAHGVRIWRSVRNPYGGKLRRKISLTEAVHMAEVACVDFLSTMLKAAYGEELTIRRGLEASEDFS